MSAARDRAEHLDHRCTLLGGDLVNVAVATARARDLHARGQGAERAARCAVSEQLVRGHEEERKRTRLMEIWQLPVVRWCRAGAGQGVVPEDAAHDALIRLSESLHRVQDPARLHGFVWGLVWRVLREHERRPSLLRWVFGSKTEVAGPSLEVQVERRDRMAAVQQVLHKLRVEDREVLWLTYAEGMRRLDVAEVLDVPIGTLNRRLTRARARFETAARRAGLAPEVDRV